MRWHIVAEGKALKRLQEGLSAMGDDWTRPPKLFESEESEDRAIFAIEGVAKSDGLVVVNGTKSPGEFEMGVAIGLNKRIVLIGPKELDSHYLPTVEHYRTQKAFLETREDEKAHDNGVS